MALTKHLNQHNQQSMKSFSRLLAEYRASVYETHFLDRHCPTDLAVSESIPTILVIEDNRDQWFLTRWALLQRFTKAHIHWLTEASSVMPYLDSCRQRERDLPKMILVDLYLPSAQQGLNLLQALKSHPLYKRVPTFTLSSSNSVEDIVQAFNHSADGYLVKPTSYQDWLAELSLLDKFWN